MILPVRKSVGANAEAEAPLRDTLQPPTLRLGPAIDEVIAACLRGGLREVFYVGNDPQDLAHASLGAFGREFADPC